MAPRSINTLLDHIYGPYDEHFILRPDFPRPGVKLEIRDLELYFDGEPEMTGFDHTEFITNPPVGSHIADNPNVVFGGVIEIEDLDWLSEEGLGNLEKDFKEMDRKRHMEHAQMNISLRTYYTHRKPGSRNLKVKIACQKTLLAHYMTTKNNYEKFLIYSEYETKKRTYWIRSLHAATVDASRKFIARYRLRTMIADLIEYDPDHTPLEDRTVDWVIKRYFADIRPLDMHRRPFKEIGHHYAPRHLRHIPKAQIRGYLAEHSEWLLAHMIARRAGSTNLLDIPQWISFCKDARREAREAAREGVRWGGNDELADDEPPTLAGRLARFGESEEFWRNQLRHIQKKISTRPPTRTRDLSPEALLPGEGTSNGKQDGDFQYDSDFSGRSSSDSSEYEDSDSEPIIELKKSLYCFVAPHIPNGQSVWRCRGPECTYQVDLLNPTPEHLSHLSPDTIHLLLSKDWKMSDAPIRRALYSIVSDHHEEHLAREEGLQVVPTSDGGWTLKRIKPLHPHPQTGSSTPVIKTEDGEEQPLRRSTRTSRVPHRA